MSSTTERQRGQVLAIFALALTVVLGAGALAFDGGLMILERRHQQNAVDAAAMAGARYVTTDEDKAKTVASNVAAANGFIDGTDSQLVHVNVPPTSGQFATWPNAIQVEIQSARPSIFGAIMGFLNWPIGTSATAASLTDLGGPFSILSIEEVECDSMKVTGTGSVIAYEDIQVNSECATSALKRQAGGMIEASAFDCNVHGGIQNEGGDETLLVCNPVEGAPRIPDPLAGLPDVRSPGMPLAVVQEGGNPRKAPSGCPGGSGAATIDSPAVCQFTSSYKDTTWRLYPGVYPGGLKLQGGNFYLEPGVYWIGGGGLELTGNGSLIESVDSGGTTFGGGVLFFNTAITGSPIGDMKLNGASANIHLLPLNKTSSPGWAPWYGLLIYQDRDYSIDGDDLIINGNDSLGMDVRGTIYLPEGDVKINGNEGDIVMDQVIAKTFDAQGNGGDILVLRNDDYIYKFTAAGLVE